VRADKRPLPPSEEALHVAAFRKKKKPGRGGRGAEPPLLQPVSNPMMSVFALDTGPPPQQPPPPRPPPALEASAVIPPPVAASAMPVRTDGSGDAARFARQLSWASPGGNSVVRPEPVHAAAPSGSGPGLVMVRQRKGPCRRVNGSLTWDASRRPCRGGLAHLLLPQRCRQRRHHHQ
jgi:hypothetical protein